MFVLPMSRTKSKCSPSKRKIRLIILCADIPFNKKITPTRTMQKKHTLPFRDISPFDVWISCTDNKKAPLSGAVFPMAGVAGLEPTHAGFRDPCLTNLAIPLCLRRLPSTMAIIHERMIFGKPFFENFSKKLSAAHQYAPLLSITALNVLKRYMRSIQMLQLRTYHVSISTRSSYVVSLLPLACHMPVMPGRTI